MPETTRTVVLQSRTQYGVERLSVIPESPYASAIRTLTKKVTVDMPDVAALKVLGFEVVVREVTAQRL